MPNGGCFTGTFPTLGTTRLRPLSNGAEFLPRVPSADLAVHASEAIINRADTVRVGVQRTLLRSDSRKARLLVGLIPVRVGHSDLQ